jgi:hypothetical protein
VARGSDVVTAARQAEAAAFALVRRHAAMISFTEVFRALGLFFVLLLPLLLVMREQRRGRGGGVALH